MSRCRKTHNLSGEDQVWLKSCDKCGETEYDIQKKLIADLKAQVAELTVQNANMQENLTDLEDAARAVVGARKGTSWGLRTHTFEINKNLVNALAAVLAKGEV